MSSECAVLATRLNRFFESMGTKPSVVGIAYEHAFWYTCSNPVYERIDKVCYAYFLTLYFCDCCRVRSNDAVIRDSSGRTIL